MSYTLPMEGYLAYAQQQRPLIKEEQPNLSFKEVGALLGMGWSALSAEEQGVFKVAWEAEKVVHAKAMLEYTKKLPLGA